MILEEMTRADLIFYGVTLGAIAILFVVSVVCAAIYLKESLR